MAKSQKKQKNVEGKKVIKRKARWFEQLNPSIDKATQERITQIIEQFQRSNDEVYTFEPSLNNHERSLVHQVSQKMGMEAKSAGRYTQRCISICKGVQKRVKKPKPKGPKENIPSLEFSKDTQQILQDLFAEYPPDEEEVNNGMPGSPRRNNGKKHRSRDDTFCKPLMSKEKIAKKLELADSKMKKNSTLREITNQRSTLPIASFKDTITSTLESHQVVLIAGETGCGKTTQVPQFLLDYMWGKRESCKIVCCQPRRISAVSVAERISYERGENVGENVGYKIRMESKGGKHSSIMFCTNGILLKILVDNGIKTSNRSVMNDSQKCRPFDITHIIVDEIHERDRFSDFMLAILRDMLPSYPHLRLILMSATIDADRFSEYFDGCPTIRVPGFMYPVKSFYLEDVLSILKSTDKSHLDFASSNVPRDTELTKDYRAALDDAIDIAWSSDEFKPLLVLFSSGMTSRIFNYQHSLTGATPLMVFAGKGRVDDVRILLSFGADCHLRAQDGSTALEWAQREIQDEVAEILKHHLENKLFKSAAEQELLKNYYSSVKPEQIDVILIERLLRKICMESREGAILVFLPGWDAINKTRDVLLASELFRDSNKFLILTLHSMVPAADQKKVFRSPPRGSRKIILSTNIAETAITIDDVVCVIDSGRMKEKSYDPYNNVSTLHSSWISKANAKQREGRAGRCQAGICYHLYSKTQAAALADFQVPEIKRMPIEELCLQVKILDPDCKISDFLQKTLDPPVSETIRNAIIVLQDIGALTVDQTLTELGKKLGALPVHPSTSKMLFFSILMNCLDPALTLACASENRDPFILPMVPEEKTKALAAKAKLASLYGGQSDQLMVIAAYDCWKYARDKGQESQFCSQYFISSSTMYMLSRMRKQLQNELVKLGFIPEDVSSCSLNAQDTGILNAVLVAGLYPMVGKVVPHLKPGEKVLVETPSNVKVRLHPRSSNCNIRYKRRQRQVIVMFDEITNGDGGMFIRNSTVVGPYPLLLLATEMVVAPGMDNEDVLSDEGDKDAMSDPENNVTLVVDRWLNFKTTALDAAQIYCLRERLNAAILFKVKYPHENLPPHLGASMFAIACLLSYDGISEPLKTLCADSSEPPKTLCADFSEPPKTLCAESSELPKTLCADSSEPPKTLCADSSEPPKNLCADSSEPPKTLCAESSELPKTLCADSSEPLQASLMSSEKQNYISDNNQKPKVKDAVKNSIRHSDSPTQNKLLPSPQVCADSSQTTTQTHCTVSGAPSSGRKRKRKSSKRKRGSGLPLQNSSEPPKTLCADSSEPPKTLCTDSSEPPKTLCAESSELPKTLCADSSEPLQASLMSSEKQNYTSDNNQKPKVKDVVKDSTCHSDSPTQNKLLPSLQVCADSSQTTIQTHCAVSGAPSSGLKRKRKSSKRKRGSGPPPQNSSEPPKTLCADSSEPPKTLCAESSELPKTLCADSSEPLQASLMSSEKQNYTSDNNQKPKVKDAVKDSTCHSDSPTQYKLLPSPQVSADSSQTTTQTHCAVSGAPSSGRKRKRKSSKRKRGSGPPPPQNGLVV